MLGIMRKYQKSPVIKIIFWVIVLSFIGTIFLIWGKGQEAEKSTYAAKVNGKKISMEEFQQGYGRLSGIYKQLYSANYTPELEKSLNLKKLAINSLVDAMLIRQEAKHMGVRVSDNDVKAEIAKNPSFQKNGAFDFQQYQQVLAFNRISPAAFEDSQKDAMMAQKARQTIKDKVTITDDEALQAFKKQNDKVELQFASFSPSEVRGEVKLTDQDLQGYLQKHQDEFKTSEQISLSYLLVEPSQFTGKLTVTDDDAQAFYQKNIDRYQEKGEILPFEKVRERAKADALKLKAAKHAYETVADTLNKQMKSGDIAAAAKELSSKVTDTPLFTAKTPPASIAGEVELLRKAFIAKTGEFGGPVETARGIYLFKVKDRKPADVPPLAQIRSQVEAKAAIEKAQELARKKAEDALAQLAKGAVPAKVQETGSFGFSAKGDIPKVGASPEMMEAAFNLTSAAPAAKTPFKVGERWYAIKLKNRIETNKENFAHTKEQVKQTMLPRKQEEAVNAWLQELRKKAKIEINPALLSD
ncbi:MAG: SurA N-terminal domain-containing protein [Geobacter sp.]|nr:SurA N-terminal domain-containing protein [Geobacter sp.]